MPPIGFALALPVQSPKHKIFVPDADALNVDDAQTGCGGLHADIFTDAAKLCPHASTCPFLPTATSYTALGTAVEEIKLSAASNL